MDQDHRRSADRAPLGLSASLTLPSGASVPTRIANMGPDGAFVARSPGPDLGERVRLAFELESHPIPFDVEAEVRWAREGEGFGVQFLRMTAYDRAALDDFCQRRLELMRLVQTGALVGDGGDG